MEIYNQKEAISPALKRFALVQDASASNKPGDLISVRSGIGDLPVDVLESIYERLTGVDRASFLSTNSEFHHMPFGDRDRLQARLRRANGFFEAYKITDEVKNKFDLVRSIILPQNLDAQMAIIPSLIHCTGLEHFSVHKIFSPPPLLPTSQLIAYWPHLTSLTLKITLPTSATAIAGLIANAPICLRELDLDIRIDNLKQLPYFDADKDEEEEILKKLDSWSRFSQGLDRLGALTNLKRFSFYGVTQFPVSVPVSWWSLPALPPSLTYLSLNDGQSSCREDYGIYDWSEIPHSKNIDDFMKKIKTLGQLKDFRCLRSSNRYGIEEYEPSLHVILQDLPASVTHLTFSDGALFHDGPIFLGYCHKNTSALMATGVHLTKLNKVTIDSSGFLAKSNEDCFDDAMDDIFERLSVVNKTVFASVLSYDVCINLMVVNEEGNSIQDIENLVFPPRVIDLRVRVWINPPQDDKPKMTYIIEALAASVPQTVQDVRVSFMSRIEKGVTKWGPLSLRFEELLLANGIKARSEVTVGELEGAPAAL